MSPFTREGTAAGEERVAHDLDRITAAVLEASRDDDLLALYLLGGYARGEGVVVAAASRA